MVTAGISGARCLQERSDICWWSDEAMEPDRRLRERSIPGAAGDGADAAASGAVFTATGVAAGTGGAPFACVCTTRPV